MKKLHLFAMALVVLCAVWVYSETVVYQPGISAPAGGSSEVMYCYVYETDGDVNDFTSDEFTIGNAIIDRIVVDCNGTDTSFKLYLYDCGSTYNDFALWTKADCSTAAMPVSEAISMSDLGSTEFRGVPVNGNLKITLADGDDATLANLEVFVYYRRR